MTTGRINQVAAPIGRVPGRDPFLLPGSIKQLGQGSREPPDSVVFPFFLGRRGGGRGEGGRDSRRRFTLETPETRSPRGPFHTSRVNGGVSGDPALIKLQFVAEKRTPEPPLYGSPSPYPPP